MFLFLFVCSLLVPLTMIILGRTWGKRPPKNRNGMSGYRTRMSMLNEDTWKVAHEYWGKIGFILGLILIILTGIVLFRVKDKEYFETVASFVVFIQLGVFVLTVVPVEIKLHKMFDENGHRK